MADITPEIDFPEKLQPLFQPYRYKVLFGGRGGMKSHSAARALLIQGMQSPLRILCARELQKSIKDSVHRVLSDLINELQLQSFYTIQNAAIKGANGTEFFFEGLRHNAAQIKSYEGVDRVWVEEAATVSKASWDFLIPTIRKEGSEIWITFNPELAEDETYQRFVLNPPNNSFVAKVNFTDNPWLSNVLRQEMEIMKARDEAAYLNVWEGHCKAAVEGAVYAAEIRQAMAENRITIVPHDTTLPVNTFWDLGWADNTSIWFVQKVGLQYRIIDFYQNSHQSIQHYVKVLQEKPYIYGKDYLPHDARAKQLGTGKSIEELLQSLGRQIDTVPIQSIADGIQAVRTVMPACWFDSVKCADGLQALRRYRYDVNNAGTTSREPLHDENSHAADAWRYFASAPYVAWDMLIERQEWHKASAGKLMSDYNPYADERMSV